MQLGAPVRCCYSESTSLGMLRHMKSLLDYGTGMEGAKCLRKAGSKRVLGVLVILDELMMNDPADVVYVGGVV